MNEANRFIPGDIGEHQCNVGCFRRWHTARIPKQLLRHFRHDLGHFAWFLRHHFTFLISFAVFFASKASITKVPRHSIISSCCSSLVVIGLHDYPSTIRFSAILRYFFCCSIPITLDAPKSRPAASMVPDPAKQSSNTPSWGSRYFTHHAATS